MRNAMQAIADDFDLRIELRLIIQLLKIAPTATTEVGARWFHSNRRGLDDSADRSKCKLAAHAIDSHAHDIAGRG